MAGVHLGTRECQQGGEVVIIGCPESRDVSRSAFARINQVGAAPAEYRLPEVAASKSPTRREKRLLPFG